MDAYVLSKLGRIARESQQTVTGDPGTEAYAMFTEACNRIYNSLGYDEELVAFINRTVWAGFQRSPEISRFIAVNDFKQGGADIKVRSINGVPLIPAPDSRMKTAFIFYDGRTEGLPDQTAGGFVPDPQAENIGMLVMPKRAASLVKKTEKIRIFDPDKNQQADAWKFDYRLYYDLIVKESLRPGIVAYIY